jgi:hypothetical protein
MWEAGAQAEAFAGAGAGVAGVAGCGVREWIAGVGARAGILHRGVVD